MLEVPRGWVIASEDESSIKILEPESKAIAAPLSGKQAPKAPRASIAVARSPASSPDPRVAASMFADSFALAVPVPLKRVDEGAVVFKDGVAGASITISFEVAEGRGVLQRHFFRIDGDTLTQITATVADWQRPKLDKELTPIALSVKSSP